MSTPFRTSPAFAFFGTPDRAVFVLDILKSRGYLPRIIITQPDKPQGRKLIITPPPVKVWAEKEHIPVIQPTTMKDEELHTTLKNHNLDVIIVVAYGKIIPETILSIPKKGAVNLHASLLPLYRGSCPIETAILNDDRHTGISIIKMDKEMDHGPLLATKEVTVPNWPPTADELAKLLVTEGANLIADILPSYLDGTLIPQEQDHAKATYTVKIVKEDGLINLNDDPYLNFRKYQAYQGWPGSFFFTEEDGKKLRVKISEARFENGKFLIKKVILEGKKEIPYTPSLL